MKFNKAFPTSKRYIRGSDLVDEAKITGEISHVEMRVIGRDTKINKPVLLFVNACSPLVLNETNWQVLEAAFGDDSSDWAGQRVELTGYDGVMNDGKPFRGVKVTPLVPISAGEREAAIEAAREAEHEAEEAAAAKAKRPASDLDDENPWK